MDQTAIEIAEGEGMPPLPEPQPKQPLVAVATVCNCLQCRAFEQGYSYSGRKQSRGFQPSR